MRVGFFGSGRYARVHHRHLSRIEGLSFSVFSPRRESCLEFAAETGATPYHDFHELLENVDAVTIATPTQTHVEYAEVAVAAGKHVYIEKPLDRYLERAEGLLTLADGSSQAVMVGQTTRFFPMYELAHRTASSGKLGKVAAARFSRRAKLVGGLHGWFSNRAFSGGALLDLGIHDFDFLRWTLGEVESVSSCSTGAQAQTGADYALTILRFKNGAVAHVESELRESAEPGTSFEICGSDGMIEWDSRSTSSVRSGGVFEQNFAPNDDPFFKALSAWVDCARTGAPVPISVRDGFESLRIADAAERSAISGQIVRL